MELLKRYTLLIALTSMILIGCAPTPPALDKMNAGKSDGIVTAKETDNEELKKEPMTISSSIKPESIVKDESITAEPQQEKPTENTLEKSAPEWLKDGSFIGVDGRNHEFDENGSISDTAIREILDDGKKVIHSNGMIVSYISKDSISIETENGNTTAYRDNGSQEWLNDTIWITDDSRYDIELRFNAVGRPTDVNGLISIIEKSTEDAVVIGYYRNGSLESRYHLRRNSNNQASITLEKDGTIIKGMKLEDDIEMYLANRGPWWLEDVNLADDGDESFEFDRNGLIDQGSTEFKYADRMYVKNMSDDFVSYILIRGNEKARVELSRIDEGEFHSYSYVEYRIGNVEPIKKVEGLELV